MKYYRDNNIPDLKVHTDIKRILYLVGTIKSHLDLNLSTKTNQTCT